MSNKRRSFKCRVCTGSVRTRKRSLWESKVCGPCITDSVHRAIPPPKGENRSKTLEWEIMREHWFHELLWRNLEHNQLQALGMGRLWYINEEIQRKPGRMGRYVDRAKNEYDLLLDDPSGRKVCIEIKRVADEASVAQIMRYKRAIEKAGFKTPSMVLVACEIPSKVMDVIEEFQDVGWPIRAFMLTLGGSGFQLKEMKG